MWCVVWCVVVCCGLGVVMCGMGVFELLQFMFDWVCMCGRGVYVYAGVVWCNVLYV